MIVATGHHAPQAAVVSPWVGATTALQAARRTGVPTRTGRLCPSCTVRRAAPDVPASRAAAVGPTSWPTVDDLARYLRSAVEANRASTPGTETMRLLTVAVAAGWLRYDDDGTGT